MWKSDRRPHLLGEAAFTHALDQSHTCLFPGAPQQEATAVRPVYRGQLGQSHPLLLVSFRSNVLLPGVPAVFTQEAHPGIRNQWVQIQNANPGIKNRLLMSYSAFVKEARLTS